MKKVIATFYPIDIKNEQDTVLVKFEIIKNIETNVINVMCEIKYPRIDFAGNPRFEYSVSEFEYEFKINIADLL